jgi:hypothetical protein
VVAANLRADAARIAAVIIGVAFERVVALDSSASSLLVIANRPFDDPMPGLRSRSSINFTGCSSGRGCLLAMKFVSFSHRTRPWACGFVKQIKSLPDALSREML